MEEWGLEGKGQGKELTKSDNNLFFKSISVLSTVLPRAGVVITKTWAYKTPLSVLKWNTIFLKEFVSFAGFLTAARTQPNLACANVREPDSPPYSSETIRHLALQQIFIVASCLNQDSSLGVNLLNRKPKSLYSSHICENKCL